MNAIVSIVTIGVIAVAATVFCSGWRWRRGRRRQPPPVVWELKVTTPDGVLVDVDTEVLWFTWKFGGRSTDGYLDLLGEHRLGWHLWVKPLGWSEPDERLAQLDGTGAIVQG